MKLQPLAKKSSIVQFPQFPQFLENNGERNLKHSQDELYDLCFDIPNQVSCQRIS